MNFIKGEAVPVLHKTPFVQNITMMIIKFVSLAEDDSLTMMPTK